ncbi:hypothetical protein PR003_g24453 [Phytophthora rubi]|uniref:Uncharacterized protein n=1 Tax=Phytophthora rubi TaxID=129364 RepID=A0A6A3H1A7_9STRA|nr:hypothetical protein PR002_g29319 [Phytophthora rubi]KAE9293662.1 hypothetical protein PR003_g24453 [Phytophthora rubi]
MTRAENRGSCLKIKLRVPPDAIAKLKQQQELAACSTMCYQVAENAEQERDPAVAAELERGAVVAAEKGHDPAVASEQERDPAVAAEQSRNVPMVIEKSTDHVTQGRRRACCEPTDIVTQRET